MASVVITINTDGAAFHTKRISAHETEEFTIGQEVARILEIMANNFRYSGYSLPPYDSSGNQVGKVEEIE